MKGTATICILSMFAVTLAQCTPDALCPYPSYEPTKFQVPGDCTKYYECMDGTKTLLSCPSGYEFSVARQECDPPAVAKCSADEISNVPAKPVSDIPYCYATGDEIKLYPYEGDCSKYWACYQLNVYLYECPKGLLYNEKLEICDWSENVDC